ncbi:S1/P1 nuclease [Thalassolituus sp. LLYu03]|uniref:S1/P1 nuclease n=1 Tax=Thalassolituus sp. LLYu03 TaxID=3421656 RepID=UPI003D2DD296
MVFRMRSTLLALSLLLTAPVHAFDASGHIAICELAWQRVSADTRDWLARTAAASPEKRFSRGCAWPDEVRNERAFEHTKVWHYVNVSRSATSVLPGDCPASGCVVSAIDAMSQRLLARSDDWQALFFLGHFIGDLHQPLHVSYADDRGGNRTDVRLNGEKTNLHALWDGELLGPFKASAKASRWQQTLTQAPHPQWTQGSLLDWASESLSLTRDIYRQYQPKQSITTGYLSHYGPLLDERMQMAGVRLADTLERIHEKLTKPPKMD